jgi:hypothetical protein
LDEVDIDHMEKAKMKLCAGNERNYTYWRINKDDLHGKHMMRVVGRMDK